MAIIKGIKGILIQLGVLRLALGLLAIIFVAFAPEIPEVGTQAVKAGVGVIRGTIMPAIVPLIFMGLMFDALMSRVLMVDSKGAPYSRFKVIIIVNLLLAIFLILAWLPFFLFFLA